MDVVVTNNLSYQIAGMVKKKIFWLEVTVDDILGMQVLENKYNDASKEPCSGRVKLHSVTQMTEKFSPNDTFYNHIHVALVMKRTFHSNDEWMLIP